jgi:hypothetical protein
MEAENFLSTNAEVIDRGTIVLYHTIRNAILHRQIVVATYDGHRRWMCPHVLGMTDHVPHALMYQFAGGSQHGLGSDGSEHNWRCLVVAQLQDVEIQEGPWHTAPNYSAHQHCVQEVDVEIGHGQSETR